MEQVIDINNINEYNQANNHKTLHPLVSVIDFSKADQRSWSAPGKIQFHYNLYCIYLKDVKCGDIKYGRQYYDYQAGTLVFFAPGQISELEYSGVPYQPMGYGLVFHPDLLLGTHLNKGIHSYNFFSYQTNEALHVSDDERQIVLDCLSKIEFELKQPVDQHSKKLIVSNIELFFNYCDRFYNRQFNTRDNVHKGILNKFDNLLDEYFKSDKPQELGLPTVTYFADALHLSPNYFGDLVKKESGQSAKEFIQSKIISLAKGKLFEEETVNHIASELGFKYPQHFSRFFKEQVGYSPNQFKFQNN